MELSYLVGGVMKFKSLGFVAITGVSALCLGACATGTGGPLGGSAVNGNDAEAHCQKYGKHAEPNSIADNGMITFKCITGDEKQAIKEEANKTKQK